MSLLDIERIWCVIECYVSCMMRVIIFSLICFLKLIYVFFNDYLLNIFNSNWSTLYSLTSWSSTGETFVFINLHGYKAFNVMGGCGHWEMSCCVCLQAYFLLHLTPPKKTMTPHPIPPPDHPHQLLANVYGHHTNRPKLNKCMYFYD